VAVPSNRPQLLLLALLTGSLSLLFGFGPGRVAFAQPAPGGTISAIRIVGNQRVEAAAIRSHITAQVGTPLNSTVVDQDLKSIEQMGLFQTVSAEVKHENGRLILIYEVKERPYITNVKLEGMKAIKTTDSKVAEATKVRPGSILDPDLVDDTTRALRTLYQNKGYPDVKIDFETIPGPNNSATAVFHVTEGPRVVIGEVDFVGNKALSTRELRSSIETSKHNLLSWLLGTGVLNTKVLQEDRERIAAAYYNHGYLSVRVGEPVVTRHKNKLTITFDIDEGSQFKVGSVTVAGDTKVSPDFLKSFLKLKKGDVFKPTTMQHDVLSLSDFYSDRGYAFVNVEPRTQINPDNDTVAVTFQVNPGHEVTVDRINISGNTKTSDKVIRRELVIQEQQPYSASAIRASKQRLDALGILSSTQFTTSPGRTPEQIDLNLAVREAQTGSFSIAGGFDSITSLFGDFHVGEKNLFGGGQSVAFDAMIGYLFRNYTLSYTEPWFLDMPLSAGIDLFDWEEFLPSFTRKSTGLTLRTSYPLAELGLTRLGPLSLANVDAGLDYRFESVGVEGIAPYTSYQILKWKGYSLVSEFEPSLRRFTVDNPVDPRSGSVESLTLQFAGAGGQNSFVKGLLHVRYFFPFINNQEWGEWVYEIGGDFGIGTNLGGGSSGELPLFARYFPGGPYGQDALPGYPFYSLGPRVEVYNQYGTSQGFENVGGSKELLLENEVDFPIMTPLGLRGYVFADAGNAFYLDQAIYPDRLQGAAGVGIFWKSPFGPLRIAIGFPINPRPDDTGYDFILGAGANL
jgi:outer membrane protein insertion porin family